MKTLPDHIKKDLLKDIEINRNIIDNTETTYEDLLVGVNDSKFDQDLRDDFFEYIEWYETDKNIKKLENIFPELFVE